MAGQHRHGEDHDRYGPDSPTSEMSVSPVSPIAETDVYAQKELVTDRSQKEAFPLNDPDRQPQAVYPRGFPTWVLKKPEGSDDGRSTGSSGGSAVSVRHYLPDGATSIKGSKAPSIVYSPSVAGSTRSSRTERSSSGTVGNASAASTFSGRKGKKTSEAEGPVRGKKVCGLRRRTFWILFAVVSLLVVAGTVGGVVASILMRQNRGGNEVIQPPSVSNEPPSTSLLASSRLTAVNYTDAANQTYHAVFSQDLSNTIAVSVLSPAANQWTTVNVSAAVASSLVQNDTYHLKSTFAPPRPGTPLAAVATYLPDGSFEMHLYCVSATDATLMELVTTDPAAASWSLGQLHQARPRAVSVTSDLSAMWHRCAVGCTDAIYVAYEDKRNMMMMVNSSEWDAEHSGVGPPGGAIVLDPVAALEVYPMVPWGRANETHLPTEIHVVFADAFVVGDAKRQGSIREGLRSRNESRRWEPGMTVKDPSKGSSRPQLAVTLYDDYFRYLMVSLQGNGTLLGYRWDNGTAQTEVPIVMAGGPSPVNFTSISMSGARQFFGVMNGSVEHYGWEVADPFTFKYVGRVELPDPRNSTGG